MAVAPVSAMPADQINPDLLVWDEVANVCEWRSLLVGNGLSRNLWADFDFNSLFELACAGDGAHLNAADVALFNRLDTRNFEAVLEALSTSQLVATTLDQPTGHLVERETSIRNALVRAVHGVHVPWNRVPETHLDSICDSLVLFSSVYSTNYDLLIYWSFMRRASHFRDFFFSGTRFDAKNTEIRGEACAVHFLHGGLHLYRAPNGGTLKRAATPEQNLLDLFGEPFQGASPLFVSEGTSQEKLSSIYRSDYLSFAFSRLEADEQPLVIFGHSLGESDRHIIRAIGASRSRKIAVAMLPGPDVVGRKAVLLTAWQGADLYFFDATTHPLGARNLRIKPQA